MNVRRRLWRWWKKRCRVRWYTRRTENIVHWRHCRYRRISCSTSWCRVSRKFFIFLVTRARISRSARVILEIVVNVTACRRSWCHVVVSRRYRVWWHRHVWKIFSWRWAKEKSFSVFKIKKKKFVENFDFFKINFGRKIYTFLFWMNFIFHNLWIFSIFGRFWNFEYFKNFIFIVKNLNIFLNFRLKLTINYVLKMSRIFLIFRNFREFFHFFTFLEFWLKKFWFFKNNFW